MEIIKTNKGGQKLVLDGFMYRKQKATGDKIRWLCTQRTRECNGAVITSRSMENATLRVAHNHAPDTTAIQNTKCRLAMKERALQSNDTPSVIFRTAVRELPEGAKAAMASEETVKRNIRRQRGLRFPQIKDRCLQGMEIIKTNEGVQKLVLDGFMYTKQKELGEKIRWHCAHRIPECNGAVITNRSMVKATLRVAHNHAPNSTAIQRTKCRVAMKERALQSNDMPSVIFRTEVRELPVETKATIAAEEKTNRNIRHQRGFRFPQIKDHCVHDMEIIKTNKGGQKLVLDGFMYTKQKVIGEKIRWRCAQRTLECNGAVITSRSMEKVGLSVAHNHAPDTTAIQNTKCRIAMKERALQSNDMPSVIFRTAVRELPAEAKAAMPAEETIKRNIRRQRSFRVVKIERH